MAERIVNEFTVNRPIDEAWPIICDLERIAPCMPGAQLTEIEGDTYRGTVKVKLGAVATEFKGEARFVERDDATHTAKLVAQGRDTKGRGNASTDVSAQAEALSPTSTKVNIVADLQISGRVAQFGRGIMGDVSKKLVDEFASNLNKMIDEQGVGDAASADVATAPAATAASDASSGSTATSQDSPTATATKQAQHEPKQQASAQQEPTVRKINGPAAEPIDLGNYAGGAVLKRAVPVVAGIGLLIFLLRKLL